MLLLIKKLKIQTCSSSNRYDRTVYVSLGEIYKILTKRVFSREYDDFKISNTHIKQRIQEGWQEDSAKEQGNKVNQKEKEKQTMKEKALIQKKLAVSIIEDVFKPKMKAKIIQKKKAYHQFYERQGQQMQGLQPLSDLQLKIQQKLVVYQI